MPDVGFRNWLFGADVEQTRVAYAKEQSGYSDECTCSDCENYRNQKQEAFPSEALVLFQSLGIDYRKECEAYAIADLADGRVRYSGWFHFAGLILEGPDCKRIIGKDLWAIDLLEVAPGFKIGFTVGNDLSYFESSRALVQVEFECELPWTIDRPRESET